MTHNGNWLRGCATLIVALTLSTASFVAQAASDPLLASLHHFRISNFSALNAYYQFTVSGDTEILNEVVAAVNDSNSEMNTISTDAKGVLNDDQISQLTKEFDSYKNLMRQNINDVRKNGYPDLRLVSDMANQAQTLSVISDELYEISQSSEGIQVDQRVEAARSAALLMAKMMTKYSARSTSSVSQTFQGAASEEALDVQARKFDSLISQITTNNTYTGELKETLHSVASKWGFIRGSYINFNENNVSFVIDRYSKGILSELNEAINLMTGTTSQAGNQATS
ncbi:MAG: hypothetical protein CL581_03955 [Alteromonadaceae bacterium]|uniref:hypothetical protein n=1 Tax=unclassified Marinobacter TaxID=83889 RepID=UPI000C5C159C|nr:hypothetical protein [Marinobacter sp. BGYM27]MAA63919.1 hypothetical protein [Alteromonadaceae bacterium]MBH85692.1 hypothetical protein [Alteromonadaceae bacterium]MDG5500417.1 hypothetical protein [Marinobacter sp. BGYM27]|tara:strand:+ start:58267 stop:59115 length:849 start_codon:yes stop_codon:yes gene_type:complete